MLVAEFSWSGRSSDHYTLRPMCKTALSKVFFRKLIYTSKLFPQILYLFKNIYFFYSDAVNRCRNFAPCDRCMFEQTMREIIRISKQRVRDMKKRMSGGTIQRVVLRAEDLEEFYSLDDEPKS